MDGPLPRRRLSVGLVLDPDRPALRDRPLELAEDRVARRRRARVDPADQLVGAGAAIARDRLPQRAHDPLAPLAPEPLGRRGERARLALREPRGTREALVERDVDAVPLDVEIEEVVGREGRRPDPEQELQILEDLLLRDAALARQ